MSRVIEMRTYKTRAGARDQFIEIFRAKVIPAHEKIGMQIVGPFLAIEDADTFFWMRIFPDLASRDGMKHRFYEGDLWKHELEPTVLPLLDKYDAVLIEDRDNTLTSAGV